MDLSSADHAQNEPTVPIASRAGHRIASLDEWRQLAPPAKAVHWKEGRSAMELARLWVGGEGQRLTSALLRGHPAFADVALERALAEDRVSFDAFPRGPRNHDLLVVGRTHRGPVVIGIEAKADEPFDRTLREYRRAAEGRLAKGQRTEALARLEGLRRRILPPGVPDDARLDLRYQLFSATAGTLASARRHDAPDAVLLIHELLGSTQDDLVARNAADLAAFLRAAFGAEIPGQRDWLLGPFSVPGDREIAFFVGKLTSPLPMGRTAE